MNEFEWRLQLRELHQPVAPPRDLWAGIEQALDQRPTQAAPRRAARMPWLLAASLAATTVLAIGLAPRLVTTTAGTERAFAGSGWKPGDPRLAGAAIELDAAQLELRQAMHQAPDSSALQRLLLRTEKQQSRLRQFEHEAG
jgi:hypothetical protein